MSANAGVFDAGQVAGVLKLLSPTLGDANGLEVFSKICFMDNAIYTYNDQVATIYNWKHDLGEFGVDGRTFISAIQSLGGKSEVALKRFGNQLTLRSGNTTVKLVAFDSNSFVFKRPTVKNPTKATLLTSEAAGARLSAILGAIADRPVNIAFAGPTLKVSEDALIAYSTTGSTMVKAVIGKASEYPETDQVIIPKLALLQLINALNMEQDESPSISFDDEHAIIKVGKVTVAAKTIPEKSPDFEKALSVGETLITISKWQTFNEFKDNLDHALGMALVVSDECRITNTATSLDIVAKGDKGGTSVKVNVPSTGEVDHTFTIDPALLSRALNSGVGGNILIREESLLLGDKKFLYAVATKRNKE